MRLRRPFTRAPLATEIADSLFLDEADGVALVDALGVVKRANPRFAALAGGPHAWGFLPPEAASRLGAALRASRACTVDARLADVALRLTLLPLAHGGGLLRLSDHTHERELEDQLAQARRLQALGQLAGGIAHDFNNLLTAILGATEDLSARFTEAPDREELDQIRESAARGAGLVRQLLAFSRQQTLQPQVLALNQAVRNTGRLLHRVLGSAVTLTLQLEEPGRLIRIDPSQLDSVLVNLAVNARHAMPRGGVLTLSTGRRLVLRPEKCGGETLPPGRYAVLRVRDTGSGMNPEVLQRIFEPFFTTRRDAGGTGLGLSTVHGIVRQSGGSMTVESTPGVGTCFTILLPRHEGPAAWQDQPETTPQPSTPPSGRTVLLVDDEAPLRRLAERVLARAGWRVLTAGNAEEALRLAEADDPALGCVVSDVMMPGLDGPALVRALRATRPGLPAILISGYADAGLRQALAASDIVFLAKPFAMAELARVLDGLPSDSRHVAVTE